MDDVFADVILSWLKQHIKGQGLFSSEAISQNLHLAPEKVERGLRLLRQIHKLVDHEEGQWKFNPEAAVTLTPYFSRNPACEGKDWW